MKIILSCNANYPADDTLQCDMAVIDLDRMTAEIILDKVKFVEHSAFTPMIKRDLHSMVFSFPYISFMKYMDDAEDYQCAVDPKGFKHHDLLIVDGLEIPEDQFTLTEGETIIIYNDRNKMRDPTIFFEAYPRKADFQVHTGYLPLWIVKKAAEEEPK